MVKYNMAVEKYILHLSHTDIRYDSRILKELHALDTLSKCRAVGIGFELDEGASNSNQLANIKIITRRLFTRRARFLPRPLRYALNFLELTAVLFVFSIRFRPAVVHCHDTLVLLAGWLVKITLGCRLVYDAHELESNKNGQTPVLSKGTLLIERFCWEKIDLLVTVSDAIIRWYKDNLGPKESILVLNSPVVEMRSTELCDAPSELGYLRQRFGIPRECYVFVYLGILGSGRGIEQCLDAFADDSLTAHVVFVGYGELEAKIGAFSDKHKNIHLHPPVPHEQVVSTVESADYGLCFVENVSLSDFYCLPNKLFEYAFAGLPVLASDFPEIRRVVQEYSLGICCLPDSESVRRAIQSAIECPRSRVTADLSGLSWATQAEGLRDAYCALLGILPFKGDGNSGRQYVA